MESLARQSAGTIEQAMEVIQSDGFIAGDGEEPVDITIIPPEVDHLSDEEDEGDEAIPHDVPGHVEIHVRGQETGNEPEQPADKKAKRAEMCWRRKQPEYSRLPPPTDGAKQRDATARGSLDGKSPVHLFEELFSEPVWQHIITETLRYAADTKNDPLFSLSTVDLKAFVGILLMSGYHKLPSERHYWANDGDLGVDMVRSTMSRATYLKLKAYIHFQNNSEHMQNKNDRGFKVRPLIRMLNESFQKFGILREELAIDEMMVKYFGNNSLKQFIRGKPIRFGYKMWALCDAEGFCYKYKLYCGKDTENKHDGPLGSRVVKEMLEAVSVPSDHRVYFDNLFTSRQLLITLASEGYRATGTVRENRTDKCPLTDSKTLAKKSRGSYEMMFDTSEEITAVRWNDNRCVTVMSNFETDQPTARVKRWDRNQRAHRLVEQPRLINSYNKYMGGVDAHDWLCGKYATGVRGKKWYWCLFTRMLDMCMVNAWLLHRRIEEASAMPLLEFRRYVAVTYMKMSVRVSQVPRSRVLPDIRYDGLHHYVSMGEKQRRCQMEGCGGRPRSFCTKCQVVLCVLCFLPYHQQ